MNHLISITLITTIAPTVYSEKDREHQGPQTCGGRIKGLIGSVGVIHTPNFPNPFSTPIKCQWVIERVNDTGTISIYFTQQYTTTGLTFTEYLYYDETYKAGERRAFTVTEENITRVKWLQIPSSHSMSSSSATPTPPPATPTPPPATPTPAPTALPPPSKFPNKKTNRNTALYSEAMSTLKAIKERRPSSTDLADDITSFGVYVAAQLRKFRPIQQSKLKLDIQTLFYNCEAGNLDRRSNTSMSDYSDYCCESENPESPITTNLNDTESNTSIYGQSNMQHEQSMQPSIQIAGTSVCIQPDLQQVKPMQLSPSDNATMSTYYPLNEVIRISNDGSLIRESKPSQVINNSLPAVFILDKKTIVKPSTFSSAQMETTEDSDQETNDAIECLLKFNK